MPSQRQSLQRQGVPIRAQLEGPRVNEQRATYTSRTAAPPRKTRPRTSQRRNKGRGIREAQDYGPTRVGDKTSAGIGLLEAEFFGIIFLLITQLFVGTSSYGDKMMSFMKRGTLTAILFFFLALIAGIGPNAAKLSKGLGALVFVAILISSPGQDIINSLDKFFKSDWVGTSETANDKASSADTATTATSAGVIGTAEGAASNALKGLTEVQLPGIGPVFGVEKIVSGIKGLLHL